MEIEHKFCKAGAFDKAGKADKTDKTSRVGQAGKVGLAALVAAGALTTFSAGQAHADAAGIAATAKGQLGSGPCTIGGNGYSAPDGSGHSCDPSTGQKQESWCADFAGWVWARNGVRDTNTLSSGAASFYDYGVAHGTLSSTPHVGDAVVYNYSAGSDWAAHVNLVVAVNSGSITVVGGNQNTRQVSAGQVTTYSINNYAVGSTETGQRISGYISPQFTATNPSNLPAGTLVKSASSPVVKVIVGGGGLVLQASDVSADHYDLSQIVTVDDASFNALPGVPANGTVLMDQSGNDPARYVVQDGVALHIGADDWTAAGYDTRALMGVPTSWLQNAVRGTLASGLVVMNQTGNDPARYVMIGGSALPISGSEWTAAGYNTRRVVPVPGQWLREAAARPVPDGLVVMNQTGNDPARYVMIGGAAAHVSAGEWNADHFVEDTLMGVPGEWLARATAAKPADGVLVKGKGGADPTVSVTVNGSALPLTAAEYTDVWASGAITGAPEEWLSGLTGKPLANGTVVTNATGRETTRYVMAGGKAVPLTTADYTALGYDKQPLRGVPGSWEAAAVAKTVPADGTMLLSPDSTTVWQVVDNGHKRAMTAAEFGAGGYSFSDVVTVPTALTAALPTG
ncbi:hypothetical protein GCM10009759_45230 [Kitasatospora saccharophila]|uniref:Peptidase C51 domain-containing protein n=1 Tax=Kitasatospora saccharophila TaxID=407973 RepID=A0ABN2X7R1_9ACTN